MRDKKTKKTNSPNLQYEQDVLNYHTIHSKSQTVIVHLMASGSLPSAQRLLNGALAGQQGTLAHLLEHYRPILLGTAVRKLKKLYIPGESGSDVVQEVLTRAVQHFGQFRGKTLKEFAAWLHRILQNRIIDMMKNKSQTIPFVELHQLNGKQKQSHTPSSQLFHADEVIKLRQQVNNMPEPYRSVVILHYVEGIKQFSAIGNRLGRSANTVRQQWLRGLRWLKDQEKSQ